MLFKYVAVFAFLAGTIAQDYDYDSPRAAPPRVRPNYSGPSQSAPRPTPVAILKQINKHNDDGSYTYGYETGDGSFKIETKLPTGEVKGKYGYIDDTGKVRVIEYGATKYGFEPAGEGITVAPPTLVDETTNRDGTFNNDYAGSYYEEPQQPQRAAPRARPQAQPQFDFSSGPQQFAPSRSPSPVPPRASIPGAAPHTTTTNFDFGPSPVARPSARSYAPAPAPRSAPRPVQYSRPAPIDEQFGEPEPAPIRAPPRITYAQPASRPQEQQFAPAARPSPQYAPRPSPSVPSAGGRGGGILDQLSKEYALPEGTSQAVHDISLGYY